MSDVPGVATMAQADPLLPASIDPNRTLTVAMLDERITWLEARIKRMQDVQDKNTPLFEDMLERFQRMREVVHNHSNSLGRLEALALANDKSMTLLTDGMKLSKDTNEKFALQIEQNRATLEANHQGIKDLLQWSAGARTVWGFSRRHVPKLATFGLGLAVSRGWITAGNGQNFLHIFGL